MERFAADVLGVPLDPWERWLAIHGGELLPDGRPRFRKLLCIVARQNGKTHLLVCLSLYWLFVEMVSLVLGTSTNLDMAVESWNKAVQFVEDNPVLSKRIPKNGVRRAIGQNTLTTSKACRYKVAASNRKGGRSLTIKRLILDELREHQSWDAWNASYLATNAVPDAQTWAISNQGDDTAVVMASLRAELVDEDGELRALEDVDRRSGIFEWSAAKGSDAEDPLALAAANPNLNRHTDRGPFLDDLLAEARRAKRNGGEELAAFLTEILCLHVPALDPAVDKGRWSDCLEPGDLAGAQNVALVLDVSLDEKHVTLVAAAPLADGRVRGKAVKAWSGPMCTAEALRDLPSIAGVIRSRKFGWLPNGPAASLAASLRGDWAPAGCEVEEIKGELAAVCMGLAEQVRTGQFVHSGDEILTAHVTEAQKLRQGDRWVFGRRGSGHCDGAYALAAAVWLARTMPAPEGRPNVRFMG